jgi:ligand-binding SRPBCC domain-containing protein
VDEQRVGRIAFGITSTGLSNVQGGVKMTDHVTYVLPFGFLGDMVHAVWVGNRLKSIFDFRVQKIEELFGSMK